MRPENVRPEIANLCAAIDASGLTPNQVATIAGFSRDALRRWMSGRWVMRTEHALKLASVLNVDPAELLGLPPRHAPEVRVVHVERVVERIVYRDPPPPSGPPSWFKWVATFAPPVWRFVREIDWSSLFRVRAALQASEAGR